MTIKHKKKASDRSLDQDSAETASVHSSNLVHHSSSNNPHSQLSCGGEIDCRLYVGGSAGPSVWPPALSVHGDEPLSAQHQFGSFGPDGRSGTTRSAQAPVVGPDQGPLAGATGAQSVTGTGPVKRRLRVSPHRVRCKQSRQERSCVSPSSSASSFHTVVAPGAAAAAAAAAAGGGSTCDAGEAAAAAAAAASHSPLRLEQPDAAGYNSGDEYGAANAQLTEEQWQEKERQFERKLKKRGLIIKRMVEDGACLFRAVADQVYGDEEMHDNVRHFCMNYISANADYYSQYITEDFDEYVGRKRLSWVHGNHIEIQAISEMYSRPVEVLCYSTDAINIFHGRLEADVSTPIVLSYHRGTHYNSVVNPYRATIGVGLGLPGLTPGLAERQLLTEAAHSSERQHIEQTMLEDKLRATDWEATDEQLSEQVARESYLQWLRDNEKRNKSSSGCSSSTVAGGESRSPRHHGVRSSPSATTATASRADRLRSPLTSPRHRPSTSAHITSATVTCDSQPQSQDRVDVGCATGAAGPSAELGFPLLETASFMDQLPPHLLGLSEWDEADVLARVLAQSQQEYLDRLKSGSVTAEPRTAESTASTSSTTTASDSDMARPSTSRSRSPL